MRLHVLIAPGNNARLWASLLQAVQLIQASPHLQPIARLMNLEPELASSDCASFVESSPTPAVQAAGRLRREGLWCLRRSR